MNLVTSIESIDKRNIIDTACKPVRVLCSDLEYYYCKYNAGFSMPNRLVREYLSACFLQAWGFMLPPFTFVKVLREHIPSELGIPFKYFENTCFGSQKLDDTTEVNSFLTEANYHQQGKIKNKLDYLKIALFDIWIANDDRNHNNYNLLLHSEGGVYSFVPIDHERVFNTGNLDMPLYPITEESSLITAPLCIKLFTAKQLTNKDMLQKFEEYLYLCVKDCVLRTSTVIKGIPIDWQINITKLQEQMNAHLFDKEWLNNCWNTFKEYLQLTVNKM